MPRSNLMLVSLVMVVSVLCGRDLSLSLDHRARMFLEHERQEIFSRLALAAGQDEEALMLIEYHRELLINSRVAASYALGSHSRLYHNGVDEIPMGNVLLFPATHEERRRIGVPSESNFRFDRGNGIPLIDLPPLALFTRLWFGVRTIHELRHCYDALSGLEPNDVMELGSVSRVFAEGEVRAHTLEQRLLDNATNGAFMREIRALAAQDQPPEGFPESHVTHYPDGEVAFERLDQLLFEERVSPEEINSRWGSYNMAYYYAMCDQHPRIYDCRTRLTTTVLNGHPLL